MMLLSRTYDLDMGFREQDAGKIHSPAAELSSAAGWVPSMHSLSLVRVTGL